MTWPTAERNERIDDAVLPWMDSLVHLRDDLWPHTVIQLLSNYAVNVPLPARLGLLGGEDFPFRARSINRDELSPWPAEF